jgi:hypothetical protein
MTNHKIASLVAALFISLTIALIGRPLPSCTPTM